MVKLIGALIVFAACLLLGFHRAALYADRPKHIRQCIQALQRLETEISYGVTPLPQALQRTSQAIAEPMGSIISQAAENLLRNDSKPTAVCWAEAMKQGWDHTAMKSAEQAVMLQLGSTLGISDRNDQLKHIHLATQQLQSEETLAKEEQQRYEKMWRSLGALGGALIVIMMY